MRGEGKHQHEGEVGERPTRRGGEKGRSSGLRAAVRAEELGDDGRGVLGRTLLRLEVDVCRGAEKQSGSAPQTWCGEEARNGGPTDAAEARRQARAPLKIVDERPAKVRADVASDRGQGRVPVSTGRRARSRKQSKAGSHGPDSHLVDDDGVAEGAQVALVELDAVRVACGSVEQGRGVSRRAGAKARRTTGAD